MILEKTILIPQYNTNEDKFTQALYNSEYSKTSITHVFPDPRSFSYEYKQTTLNRDELYNLFDALTLVNLLIEIYNKPILNEDPKRVFTQMELHDKIINNIEYIKGLLKDERKRRETSNPAG